MKKFEPCITIDELGNAITMFLEDVPFYGSWIEGEGADICLYRAQDNNRVIGVRLPRRGIDDLKIYKLFAL